ncbi:MAG: hypothetical protein JXA21_12700 [Anaerolineae bacterium]|nr:hypothetical protein [Anaerolineae bacterium]
MQQQKTKVAAEFFAQGYRVSGTYSIISKALGDMIYDTTTDFVRLREAYISPIMDPARISAYYEEVLFDKSNLDFVLTLDSRDGLRRDQKFGMGRNSVNVFLIVPFFEIQGELRIVTSKFEPRLHLSSEAGPFLTLLNVVARSTFNPDISYEGGIALISRTKISFFGEKIN